jgi:hypothetical protein
MAEGREKRHAGMQITSGFQGVGKTYLNMHIIAKYVKDKIATKVKGRKVLIIDTNGEFTEDQFAENSIPNFNPINIGIKDVAQWSISDKVECRRIDIKSLSIPEKKNLVIKALKDFKNGMLVLEDINTYIMTATHMEEIVGGLVNLRHRGVDILISYQSLRAVDPLMFRNSRWVRMHYQVDSIDDVIGKIPNPSLYKIAQLIVNDKYLNQGEKRFHLYIQNADQNLKGQFSKADFKKAVRKYIFLNKKMIKDYMLMEQVKEDQALDMLMRQFYNQYYGNDNK